MAFKRTIENFACENCGASIRGNGYTNHCSNCLYSKHVDIEPGDRANDCQGLMQPIDAVTGKDDGYVLTHRCLTCGTEMRCRTSPNDNLDTILRVVREKAERTVR
ncbi:MAG: hypothetical protein JWR53_278 [Glaciihabitans sp.]|jgi:hypothetical protein|nr:hypothetical protein [Glaciihabitans sp.]